MPGDGDGERWGGRAAQAQGNGRNGGQEGREATSFQSHVAS